jgi:hypothetical protein
MNKMAVSLLVALSFSLAFVNCEVDDKYPVIMWSQHAFTDIKESASAMQMTTVIDKLASVVEASQAVNVVAIVQEGLTSRELVMHAKNFDFLKQQIQTHSEMYSNLREPFDSGAFAA